MKALAALLAVLLLSGCLSCTRESTSLRWEQTEWTGLVAPGTYDGWVSPESGDQAWEIPIDVKAANGRSAGDGLHLEQVSWRPPGMAPLQEWTDQPTREWYSLQAVHTNDPDAGPEAPLIQQYWLKGPRDDTPENRAHFDRFVSLILGGDRDEDALWEAFLSDPFPLVVEPPFTPLAAWNDAIPQDIPLPDNPSITTPSYRRQAFSQDWYVLVAVEVNRLHHAGHGAHLSWDAWGHASIEVEAEDGWPREGRVKSWVADAFQAVGLPQPDLSDAEFIRIKTCPD